MSDNRKILVAKRKDERNKYSESTVRVDNNTKDNSRKGFKRPNPCTSKKNLANDRLKKLRTNLNQEISKSQSSVKKDTVKTEVHLSPLSSARKRPPHLDTQELSVTKVPRSSMSDTEIGKLCNSLIKSPSKNDSVSHNKELCQANIFTPGTTATPNHLFTSLLNSTCQSEEVMEWSPADYGQPTTRVMPTSSLICNNKLPSKLQNLAHTEYFYIVVDTNIFISQMQIIQNIIEMDVTGNLQPVIFIPWIVIEELDFIKEDSNRNSLKWKAQDAIKYIEKNLVNANKRMQGQSLEEVNEQKDVGKSQDNKIISCCLQVLEKYQEMVLLTDDINLRNKAHINHIPTCSHKEILKKLTVKLRYQSKSEIILEKMISLYRNVIKECALKAYGPACNRMPICQDDLHTIQDCIKLFIKYWFPVFQEVLMKQFKNSINDLSSFLINNDSVKDGSKELSDLCRLCVRTCIFLKDIDSCKSTVESTIREINNIKDL